MSFFRKSSVASTTNQYFQEQQLQEEEDRYSFGGEASESQANNIVHTMSALGLNDDNILEPSSRQSSPPMSFLRNEAEFSSLYAQLTPKSRFITSMPSQADPQEQSSDQSPTKSLWIGNIPQNTIVQDLINRFSAFGPLESTRVLTHKNCGFINFERLEDAIEARRMMNGALLHGVPMKINFAKVPTNQQDLNDYQEILLQREYQDFHQSEIFEANMYSNGIESQDIYNYRDIQDYFQTRERSCSISSTGSIPPTMHASPNIASSLGKSASLPFINTRFLPSQTIYSTLNQPEQLFQNTQSSLLKLNSIVSKPSSSYQINQIATPHLLAMAGIPAHPTHRKSFSQENSIHFKRNYAQTIPALPEMRKKLIDQARLREARKSLEAHCSKREVESIFDEYQSYLVELATDFIGNVVLQKIAEKGSDILKTKLIQLLAPHIPAIGIHKNGTWVAQKIIDTASTTGHMQLITQAIQPYVACLMLDQFGNYVVQGCLKFADNQFIFDALSDCCLEIAKGRFGARAMRSVLESGTKRQQKQVAIAIVQHAYQLILNINGSILITWLLDFSGLPGRFRVLAPKLPSYLVELCTNKLSSSNVLKIINQSTEPDARELLLQEIFGNDNVLKDILVDSNGASFIQKILTFSNAKEKIRLADRTRLVLSTLPQVGHAPTTYKKLLEELTTIKTFLNNQQEESVSPLAQPTYFSQTPVFSGPPAIQTPVSSQPTGTSGFYQSPFRKF